MRDITEQGKGPWMDATNVSVLFSIHMSFNHTIQSVNKFDPEKLGRLYNNTGEFIFNNVFKDVDVSNLHRGGAIYQSPHQLIHFAMIIVGTIPLAIDLQKEDVRKLCKEFLRQLKLKNVGNMRIIQYSINLLDNSATTR